MMNTEQMAKLLWQADRLYLKLTTDEGTPYTWENGVSDKEKDRWLYLAEHALTSKER